MKPWQTVGIAGGAIGALILGAVVLDNNSKKYTLQIETTEGGSTTPTPSASGVKYNADSIVTVTALPNDGFTVGCWTVDGETLTTTSQSIQVTMNKDHWVTVSFWEGGVEPVSAPAFITPVSGTLTAIGYYGCKIKLKTGNLIDTTSVHQCDQNWTWDNWAQNDVAFKVIDANGRGVPGVTVKIWPDMAPDNGNNVGLVGFLAMNLWPHTINDPLYVVTGDDGIARFSCVYCYAIDDKKKKLCEAAQLWVNMVNPPFTVWAYDGYPEGSVVIFTGKGGEGITNDHPSTMGGFAINYIKANIPGTAISQTQIAVYCGYSVKML